MAGQVAYVPLKGSRRFARPGAIVLGRAHANEWCEITLSARRKAPLPEPHPDKPISRADLAAKYGADPKDLDAIEKVVTSYGATVVSKNAETHTVEIVGPVSVMEKLFDVRLFQSKHDDVVYRSRVGDVHLPPELANLVTGVFGLDSRPMIKRRKPLGINATHTLPPPNHRPWYLPQELADAYKFPAGDGAGQTIAILEFGGQVVAADLVQFLQVAGLPTNPPPDVSIRNVMALPPDVQNDDSYIGETMLDVEIVAGVCPKAHIMVFFSKWTERGWLKNLHAVATDPANPKIVSISYGLAEGDDIWTQQALDHLNDALQALASTGVTVCVSTGDDGSDDQNPDGLAHVSFPAASPYVLAVGGTSLVRATGAEELWFEGTGLRRTGGGSAGAGVSGMNPRPSWQPTSIHTVNPGAMDGRILPDVTANAAGNTGYFMVAQGSAQISGGTSAATPLWASLLGRLRQSGKQIGFLTPRLYQAAPTTGGKPIGEVACRDITMGKNASGTAEGYSAGPGFDAATGWGSPIGSELAKHLT
jgi:kumamolisin